VNCVQPLTSQPASTSLPTLAVARVKYWPRNLQHNNRQQQAMDGEQLIIMHTVGDPEPPADLSAAACEISHLYSQRHCLIIVPHVRQLHCLAAPHAWQPPLTQNRPRAATAAAAVQPLPPAPCVPGWGPGACSLVHSIEAEQHCHVLVEPVANG
jgi:hypothetical protein